MKQEKIEALKKRLERDLGKKLLRETELDVDSMEVMAICVAAEEIASVELGFNDVKELDYYGELEDLFADKLV